MSYWRILEILETLAHGTLLPQLDQQVQYPDCCPTCGAPFETSWYDNLESSQIWAMPPSFLDSFEESF